MGLNLKATAKISGLAIMFVGALMVLPSVVSLIYKEQYSATVFAITSICLVLAGAALFFAMKLHSKNKKIRQRDGLVIVSLVWILFIYFGAAPIYIICDISFIDAIFESTSGFTTTGATIFQDVESLPKGILFWRSLTHWIGGLGILILVISILPMLGDSKRIIAQTEASQSMSDRIVVRHTDSAKRLILYYVSMTLLCTVLLSFGKLGLFDSLIHTMGTVSTGGFSSLNGGLIGLNDPYSLWVLVVFMFLGSINFMIYYYLFSPRWKEVFGDTELRWYTFALLLGAVAITLDIFFTKAVPAFSDALTHGVFNFVSTLSTTGMNSFDYDLWPTFSKMILLIAMFMGGCSASTSGGIKAYRIIVAFKLIKRNLSRRLHPTAVVSIKSDEGPIRADFVSAVAAYIFFYILVIFASSTILSLENHDFITTVSAVVTCMGNVGPGFGEIGPTLDYHIFSIWGKLLLCLDMLAGRLELFGLILLFTWRFWNPDRFRV